MTDWLYNLRSLSDIYEHPDRFDPKTAGREIAGFLIHVIPHLKAAGRLLLDEISDPFEEPSGEASTGGVKPARH